ncbi:hypothetical protein ACFL6Y_09385, partial [Elusimicrobiota bacterium]
IWDSQGNSVATEYFAEISSVSDFSGSGDQTAGWTTNVTNNFANLSGNTTYYAQAKVRNWNNAENTYVSLGSTLTPTGIAVPVSADPASVASSSFTVNWTDGTNPAGTTYEAQASTDSAFGSITSSATVNIYAIFTGLEGHTTYYTRARAVYLGDQSAWTTLPSTMTIIQTPSTVIIDEVFATSITVSAYNSRGFTRLEGATPATNIAKNGSYGSWHANGNSWAARASMLTSREYFAAAALGGMVYAIGGDNGTYLDVNEEYNPATNAWTAKAPMPTARRHLAAEAVGEKLYAIGGENGIFLALNEEYDPATNTWATKTAMLTARSKFSVAVASNSLYAAGGSSSEGRINTNEEYYPAGDYWVTLAPMPTARDLVSAGNLNNKLFVIGGTNGSFLAVNEEFDPATNAWLTRAPMPTARERFTVVTMGEKLFAIGGWNTSFLDTNEEYDAAANAWVTRASMTTPRRSLASAATGARIYVIGGYNGTLLGINEEYDPGSATSFTSLTPNTQYAFKAKARDSLGRITVECLASSTYTLAALPVIVSTGSFQDVFAASFTVSWAGSNPANTEYFVEISTLSDFTGSGDKTEGWAVFQSTGFTGLVPNTTYYAQIKARNFNGLETRYASLESTTTMRVIITWVSPADASGYTLNPRPKAWFYASGPPSDAMIVIANDDDFTTNVSTYQYSSDSSGWENVPAAVSTTAYFTAQEDWATGDETRYIRARINYEGWSQWSSTRQIRMVANWAWTDPTLSTATVMKTTHFTELRTVIDNVSSFRSLSVPSWTDDPLTPGVSVIKKTHTDELRTNLESVLDVIDESYSWTDSTITQGVTTIRTLHISELRTKAAKP